MNVNTERSNFHGQSSHSIHSLPSSPPPGKEGFLRPHPQNRPRASQPPSFNPHRSSHVPSHHNPRGVNDPMAYPPHDSFRHSNRNSMVHQSGQNIFRRSYSDNPSFMLPSQPAFQAFNPSHQKRATMQYPSNPIKTQQGINPNRASRHLDMPRRPTAEPANLIHSIRSVPPTNNPKSTQLDSKRVVVGVLQSALPPSARPPPVDRASQRSMPISELEKRHKAALQKLQTHTNQRAAHTSAPAQPSPVKPPKKSQPSPVKPQKKPTTRDKPESASEASLKPEKADKAVETAGKLSSAPSRRSFFSFLTSKELSKPNKTPEEIPKSIKSPPIKTQKEARKSGSERVEAEDEDVPLAKLRDRRASYNSTSQSGINRQSKNLESVNRAVLNRCLSVPTNVNEMQEKETLDSDYFSTQDSQSHNLKYNKSRSYSVGIDRSKRASSHLELTRNFESIDNQSQLTRGTITPDLNPHPTWFQSNFDLSHEEKDGPRPLIFEDEAKAIRNSKRLWVQ